MELALAIIGTALGVVSLAHAIKTQRDKERLEKFIQAKLACIAGSLVLVRNNPALAHKNLDYVLNRIEAIREDDLKAIVNHLAWAQGDSAAAHRLLGVVLLDVLSVQEGLFGTRVISTEVSEDEAPRLVNSDTSSK